MTSALHASFRRSGSFPNIPEIVLLPINTTQYNKLSYVLFKMVPLYNYSKGQSITGHPITDHPITGHQEPRGRDRYSSTHSRPRRSVGVGGQHHASAALPPGKTRYPLYRRLGGPQGRSGRVRNLYNYTYSLSKIFRTVAAICTAVLVARSTGRY
jgi:hypothetical protein